MFQHFHSKFRYRAWTDPSPVSAFATKSLENVMQGEEKGFQEEVHVPLLITDVNPAIVELRGALIMKADHQNR